MMKHALLIVLSSMFARAELTVSTIDWRPACDGATIEVVKDGTNLQSVRAYATHSLILIEWTIHFLDGCPHTAEYRETTRAKIRDGDHAGEDSGDNHLKRLVTFKTANGKFNVSDKQLAEDLVGILAKVTSEPVGSDRIVARLKRIVIPKIEFDHASVGEAIDFLSLRCAELDLERDPAKKGISFLTNKPKRTVSNNNPGPGLAGNDGNIKITYSAKAVPILDALAEVARQAHLDIHLTGVGIVICQAGDPPFPNGKAVTGEVWKTIYKCDPK